MDGTSPHAKPGEKLTGGHGIVYALGRPPNKQISARLTTPKRPWQLETALPLVRCPARRQANRGINRAKNRASTLHGRGERRITPGNTHVAGILSPTSTRGWRCSQ